MYWLRPVLSPKPERSLVEILRQRALFQPNKIAYVSHSNGEAEVSSITYEELERKASLIGALLQGLGLAGERALLMYPPGLEFITAFFGCLSAGVIAVPAYPPRRNQSADRISAIVTDCQAKEVLTTTSVWKTLEQSFVQNPELSSLRWLATDNLASNLAQTWQPPDISSDTLAFLQYTSGSTGNPKGVMVTHGNLIHNLAQIHQCFGHTANSQGVIWLPLYHDMGLIGGVLQPLYGGFPVTLMSPLDFLQKPLRWLEAISRYQATTSGGPNFAYDLCVRKITPEQKANLDLSSWEVAFTGAEPVRAQTLETFAQSFASCGFRREAFYPCYGLAEATLLVGGGLKTKPPVLETVEEVALEKNQVVVAQAASERTRTLVGCGQSWLDQKIKIVNPDSLRECCQGQVGEIWVAGTSVAKGYWNQPQATQEAFSAYLIDTKEGPFLRTGDLGFIHKGELFVTGRLKDTIIIRGRNYYPQDLELTVQQSNPTLKPGYGAAFAVIDGEERLVIVQEVERHFLRKLDLKQVVGDIRASLAAQKGLQAYAIVLVKPGSIPVTSSGKIRRSLCRLKFLEGTLNLVEEREDQQRICHQTSQSWQISAVV